MQTPAVVLGTWIQRTALHLREAYAFFKHQQVPAGLDDKQAVALWRKLGVRNAAFTDKNNDEAVEVSCAGGITISLTEDGVVLASLETDDFSKGRAALEQFYAEKLGPALAYLFSRGAPLPKPLASLETVHPLMYLTKPTAKVNDLFALAQDEPVSVASAPLLTVTFGRALQIFSCKNGTVSPNLLGTMVFFREFENQLGNYLNLHREIWEKISALREPRHLRYRDFSRVRQRIMDFLKVLSFVAARLGQMNDILEARQTSAAPELRAELKALGLERFVHLKASVQYISHLWGMTAEYTKETLALLDSLFQENTQRELNTLKFITFIAALTGFFGMNIAFPWEERWGATAWSFYAVAALLITAGLLFYWLLRLFIYNREFTVRDSAENNKSL